jgi:hypothetical protein
MPPYRSSYVVFVHPSTRWTHSSSFLFQKERNIFSECVPRLRLLTILSSFSSENAPFPASGCYNRINLGDDSCIKVTRVNSVNFCSELLTLSEVRRAAFSGTKSPQAHYETKYFLLVRSRWTPRTDFKIRIGKGQGFLFLCQVRLLAGGEE